MVCNWWIGWDKIQKTVVTIISGEHDIMSHPQRNIGQENDNPGDQDETLNIGDSPCWQWSDRKHHSQEPGDTEINKLIDIDIVVTYLPPSVPGCI